MKILFSPSETKILGGIEKSFDKSSFIFPELFDKRMEIVNQYKDFVLNAPNEQLIKLFGTKKEDVIKQYSQDLSKSKIMKAINRYDGVAFDYLEYSKLNETQKNYIDKNVIIFSNLFGALSAGDSGLPDYKLKQGESFNNLKIEKFYNDNFSNFVFLEKSKISLVQDFISFLKSTLSL